MKKLILALALVFVLCIGLGCQEQEATVASDGVVDSWSTNGCDMDGDGDIEFDDMALYIDKHWTEEKF